MPVIYIVYYVYGIFGMFLYNTETNNFIEPDKYEVYKYANFNSLGGAYLLLFQVMVEANWTNIVWGYAYKSQNYPIAIFYFVSWYILISLILLSLIKGIVWEVFIIVDVSQKEFEKMEDAQIADGPPADRSMMSLKDRGIRNYEDKLLELYQSFHSGIYQEGEAQQPDSPNYQINLKGILEELREEEEEELPTRTTGLELINPINGGVNSKLRDRTRGNNTTPVGSPLKGEQRFREVILEDESYINNTEDDILQEKATEKSLTHHDFSVVAGKAKHPQLVPKISIMTTNDIWSTQHQQTVAIPGAGELDHLRYRKNLDEDEELNCEYSDEGDDSELPDEHVAKLCADS